ncbi:hypothetical protein EV651_111222 [Kribbella sp. VKM Ac-2571]|uniref:hypothetical protein n=1 Tax=Kribbella sp. VKM Ac-2571 TaxID=2512222 RepID=UPI00105E08B2|nr:hypothetical protein [Kribbella sp. VKM Ac-2571]TDO57496.1 hypothetical protein EV651_111222 [Kribbella sp. VKM Ac-2571]
MPATNRLIDFSTPYVEGSGVQALRASSLHLVRQLLELRDVQRRHQRELLSIALWKWTEAPGAKPYPKYNIRYVTRGVLAADDAKINHEHVWPRKWIIDKLLSRRDWPSDELTDFLDTHGVACVVTIEEHASLGGKQRMGWQRYVDAGIDVWDRQLGRWAEFRGAPSEPADDVDADEAPVVVGVDLEQVIRERAGDKQDLLIELARSAEREMAVPVLGSTRDSAQPVGAYFRIHDAQIEEPTPAVAYVHWSGKVSFRLTHNDLPAGGLAGATPATHQKYGVACHVSDNATLRTAQHLLYLALAKLRDDL